MKLNYFLLLCGVAAIAYGVNGNALPGEGGPPITTSSDKSVPNLEGSTIFIGGDTSSTTTTTAKPITTQSTSTTPKTTIPTTPPTPEPKTTTPNPDTTTTTTTVAPSPSPSPTPEPTPPSTTTTVAPSTTAAPTPPAPCRRFDAPSFIGGIVLTLGLLVIAFIAYKFYKARNELHYQTL